MKTFTIFSDGGSRGNPGQAAYGFVIYDDRKQVLFKEGREIGIATNNVAEYMGIVSALQYLRDHGERGIEIAFFMDSELAARQLQGVYQVKNEQLRSLFYTVKRLQEELEADIIFSSIPRTQNIEADALVNQALDSKNSS